MKYSSCKDIDQEIRRLVGLDWSYSRKGKHGKLKPPFPGAAVVIPCSPSDFRSYKNFLRDLRKAGYGRQGLDMPRTRNY